MTRLHSDGDSGGDSIYLPCFTFLRRAASADLGEVVGAEDTDGVDDHGEGDHELDGGGNELTGLEGDTANNDDGLRETLAAERSQERSDDALREGSEETSHNAPEVESSRQNDDVLGIEHFVCRDGEKTDPCASGTMVRPPQTE